MNRSTPDPVFAAAAQSELERRVREGRRGVPAMAFTAVPRPRRRWVTEFAAVAGLLVLVAAVAAGMTAFRPPLEQVGAPTVTETPAPDPTSTPAPSGSVEPTATATVPAPSSTPTTLPPVTPPPTTPQPSLAPTTAPPTPAPTKASSLIGPDGAKQRSESEIRTWADSLGFGSIWTEQTVLDTRCMAGEGFLYDPIFDHSAGVAAESAGMTAAQAHAFQDAYYGPQTGAPYDWRTAGCHGLSVHVTGQDDNH